MARKFVTALSECLTDLWIHLQRLADGVNGARDPVLLEETEYAPDTRPRAVLRSCESEGSVLPETTDLVKGFHVYIALSDVRRHTGT